MKYWDYLKKNRVIIFIVVIVIMVAFYVAGFWMPGINSVIEGRYLLLIIGIPLTIFIIGTLIAVLLALLNLWLFDIQIARSLALMAGLHVAFFDYVITIILFRNKVIEHEIARQWWSYCGKSSITDYVVSKVDWRVRLLVRVVMLAASIVFFV